MKKRLLITALSCLLAAGGLRAEIVLPPFFSDNMVLQHSAEVKLWGKAKGGAKVSVKPSWSEETLKTRASADGSWQLMLRTPAPGGPHTIVISDGKSLTLDNILTGDVWICGGQSNMEMKIGERVDGWKEELENAGLHKDIRLLQVKKVLTAKPVEDIMLNTPGWVEAEDKLSSFSAAAWFFGKKLNEELGIPIGLIESCWGGSAIEAWMPGSTLRTMEKYRPLIEQMDMLPDEREARRAIFENTMNAWVDDMKKVDYAYDGTGKLVWGLPGADLEEWTEAKVPGLLQLQGIKGMHGFFWMRLDVEIPESWEGCELSLRLGTIDDNDCTFFNGEYIGHTEICITPRLYKVPGRLVHKGTNTIAVRVMDTGGLSGIAGFDKELRLYRTEDEYIPLSGKWYCRETVPMADTPPFPVDLDNSHSSPSSMYNSMIYPLRDYRIKGAIWYQGESNVADAAGYKDLMPALIHDWRALWGEAFPFYFCQLANYMEVRDEPVRSEWAELREAQLQSLSVENTGMAVLIDIGEAGNIHPKNKAEVGRRLALNALYGTYGRKDSVPCGPVFLSYRIAGSGIRIRFAHADGGLTTSDGNSVKGFMIAGPDRRMHRADVSIEGDELVVSSPEVKNPVAVRYAWADNPACNLVNGAGLPASPFRTDSWAQ